MYRDHIGAPNMAISYHAFDSSCPGEEQAGIRGNHHEGDFHRSGYLASFEHLGSRRTLPELPGTLDARSDRAALIQGEP